MRIETKYLAIELEPELLTDEHLARVEKLITLASNYEQSRRAEDKIRIKGEPGEARRQGKRGARTGQ